MGTTRRSLILPRHVVLALLMGRVWAAVWDLGRECVRWSTRIDVTETGGGVRTRVCAELQPRVGDSDS